MIFTFRPSSTQTWNMLEADQVSWTVVNLSEVLAEYLPEEKSEYIESEDPVEELLDKEMRENILSDILATVQKNVLAWYTPFCYFATEDFSLLEKVVAVTIENGANSRTLIFDDVEAYISNNEGKTIQKL